ncbi:MAG TPA: TIGR02466 family protein [Bdellovibrionales bacterium]|nr:TIGR02466 family protein [Bdellovibrionales bacterium]
MPITEYFPTPIYSERLKSKGTEKFNRELLEQCYLVRETDPEGEEWSQEHYLGGYTSYGSIIDLHKRYPHFEELREMIDKHVKKFARHLEFDLQGGHLEMTSCWINIMSAQTVHSLHLHPLSVVSGTYYVDVPKNASSIKFEDPRLDRMMAAPPRLPKASRRNEIFVKMDPRAGQVALWESWLRHEVPPNRAKKDRVSISFNYDWVGR